MRSVIQRLKRISYKKDKNKISFIIYLFCVLFAPPIIPNLNLILVIALYSFVMIVTKYRRDAAKSFNESGIKDLSIGFILYLLYYLAIVFISIINGSNVQLWHYIRNTYSLLLLCPVCLICVQYIILRAKELNYNLIDLIKAFVFAGLIQSFLSIVALLFPAAKDFFISVMLSNSPDKVVSTPWITNLRYFGFANSMLDLFGFGMGIIASLSLYLVAKNKLKYIILFPLLIIPSLLNARTGLVISIIGLFFFITYLLSCNKTLQVLILMVSVTILLALGGFFVKKYAPETITWAVKDITSFVSSTSPKTNTIGTANSLFSSNFWTLPDITGIFFGTGHTLYGANGFVHSDVGYINDIWRTGIVGLFFLYSPFLLLFNKLINFKNDKLSSILSLFFIFSIAIFLVKGTVWVYSPGILIIISLACFIVLEKSRNLLSKDVSYEQ